MIQDKKDIIISLANKAAQESGFEIYDVSVRFRKETINIDVRIDNGATVSHDDCTRFGSALHTLLEEAELSEAAFLEVSSPGLKRKIRTAAEWKRFEGAPVKVTFRTEKGFVSIKGVLQVADEESATIKEGKKEHVVVYENVKHANLDY